MATGSYSKPIPDLDDPDMAPFWRASRDKQLVAQRCTKCSTLRFPALPICDTCLEEDYEWVPVSTDGVVWSYVVYHRAFHPGFEADVPYVVAIVENADGLRFTGNVIGPRDQVAVGADVKATFDAVTPEFTLVKWVLV
jgi:uncharacterized protein